MGNLSAPSSNQIRILAQQGDVRTVTAGSVIEETLATINVPANTMQANGVLQLISVWSGAIAIFQTGAMRFYFGGALFNTQNLSGFVSAQLIHRINNRDSLIAQVTLGANVQGFPLSNVAQQILAIDTSLDQPILITGQKSLGTDTLSLQAFQLLLFQSP
jgi:hypothetical protein